MHALFAYLSTGTKVRVTRDLSYDDALRCFATVDQYGPAWEDTLWRVGDYIGHVRWFAVRSADDPNWPQGQPTHDLRSEFLGAIHV